MVLTFDTKFDTHKSPGKLYSTSLDHGKIKYCEQVSDIVHKLLIDEYTNNKNMNYPINT